MPYRNLPLVQGEIYHVFTRSIAGYKVFNSPEDFRRMMKTISFYMVEKPPCKLSLFLKHKNNSNMVKAFQPSNSDKIVKILSYCFMPTHLHLILLQLKNDGISKFVNLILKSYSKYFNIKYKRKGPLWEGRFKNILVETDEQLLHLTRYIHLNPVTAFLANAPENWEASSYKEYIDLANKSDKMCDFSDYLTIKADSYRKFANNQIDYQRKLKSIKHLTFE